jgi:alpha-L-arabinofuranosidase
MRRHLTFLAMAACAVVVSAQPTITVQADNPGLAISPRLWGIFFEDINWAADGGLYAELVQNRSFEYANVFGSNFTATTAWTLVQRGGASATMTVSTQNPLNAANPHYLTLSVNASGSGAGLNNTGFAGVPVVNGDSYNFSFFARKSSGTAVFTVSLESTGGAVYGSTAIPSVSGAWTRYSAVITASATDNNARLVLVTTATGSVDMDMISLFPQKTFRNRTNGLRADLAQRLVDMKPAFVRFPGGCIVHSNNLATAYRWKTTIGPVEQRKTNANRWGYMQSCGLGFYEYFLLCEDIGARPLPVLPVGVSCHFKTPYEVTPLDSLQPWIDDALDLIEYANGSSSTTWGAQRASAGHPEPFNLEYIGVGNEEWGQEFKDRSTLFINAIRNRYPGIKIVGTAGPSPSGTDYDDLWAYNRAQNTYIVDEHYYQDTAWFVHNTHRYEWFNRTGPKVFAGEYASRSPFQKKLGNAIAEAAFMTGLERNSDVVLLSSYAPLFRNVNCNGAPAEGPWDPCLIYFDNNRSYGTPTYHAQVMFAGATGHRLLPTVFSATGGPTDITGGIGLATWATQAQFDDAVVTDSAGTLFSSDFTSGAGGWTAQSGTWSVTGGTYAQTSTANDCRSVAGNVSWTKYTWSVRARKTGGNEGFMIMFGRKDDQNFYWWNLGGWNNTQHAIEKCVAGTKSTLVSVAGSITANQWYDVRIVLSGNRIRCYLNNTLIHDIQDGGSDGPLFCVSSKDTVSGDILMKVVNASSGSLTATLRIQGAPALQSAGTITVLTSASVTDENSLAQPTNVAPVTSSLTNVSASFQRQFPAHSASVLRLKTQAVAVRDPQHPSTSRKSGFDLSAQWVLRGNRTVMQVDWTQTKTDLVTINLYNCRGALIGAVVRNKAYQSGNHHAVWSCSHGLASAPGLYIIEAAMGGRRIATARVGIAPR